MALFKSKKTEKLERMERELQSTRYSLAVMRRQTARRSAWEMASDSDLTADWNKTSQPINTELKGSLAKLRARSRDIAKNDPYALRFLKLAKNNVVGSTGFALQPRIKVRRGKETDLEACKAVAKGWKEFSKKGSFEVTGRLSRTQVERLITDSLIKDGEYILKLVEGAAAGNKFGFAVQMIDPAMLPIDYNVDLPNGNKIVMGVEVDQYGRPQFYHFHSNESSGLSYSYNRRNYVKVPAKDIIHGFITEYVDQLRGIPHFAPVGFRMKMLDGYDEAEVVSARVAASKMGIWERGENAEEWGGDEGDDGDFIDEVRPGGFEIGPEGYTFKPFDPTHPGGNFNSFRKGMIRSIAAAFGISYHTLGNDLEGVNYSSGRLGALEDRELWITLQSHLIDEVIEPIFNRWLERSLELGVLTLENGAILGGKEGPTKRLSELERYKNVSFQGRRWPWVDPLKDIKAHGEAIDRRLTSVSNVIREQGGNPDDVFQEIADEQEKMKALGILPQAKAPKPNGSESEPTSADESDEESDDNDENEGGENA